MIIGKSKNNLIAGKTSEQNHALDNSKYITAIYETCSGIVKKA